MVTNQTDNIYTLEQAEEDIADLRGATNLAADWMPMSLASGWTARGATYATPAYCLMPDGNVMTAGEVVNSSAANSSTISTLPAGYYNTGNQYLAACAVASFSGSVIAGQTIRVYLGNDGMLQVYGINAAGSLTISLDGLVFPVGAP